MNLKDDIRIYLPKYLSEESTKELIKNIGEFPDNISNSLYTNALDNNFTIFQGDGLKSLKVINLPDIKIGEAPSIILSNTCDIEPSNERPFPSQICYQTVKTATYYSNIVFTNRLWAGIRRTCLSRQNKQLPEQQYFKK